MPFISPFLTLFTINNFPAFLKNADCSIFAQSGTSLSFRAIFPRAFACADRRFLQQKTPLCVLDQKNTPYKGGEIPVRPVKI